MNNVIYQFCTEIAAYILHLFFGFSSGNDNFRFHPRRQKKKLNKPTSNMLAPVAGLKDLHRKEGVKKYIIFSPL